MYCLFGTKWSQVHHGPVWSVVPTGQTKTVASLGVLNPLQVYIYIAVVYYMYVAHKYVYKLHYNITG